MTTSKIHATTFDLTFGFVRWMASSKTKTFRWQFDGNTVKPSANGIHPVRDGDKQPFLIGDMYTYKYN